MRTQPEGCLVRKDQIRPGDVVLSRGWRKESDQLAGWAAGEGDYSHAALIMGDHFILESDDYGAGHSPLPSVWSGGASWLYLPYPRGSFVVTRHAAWGRRDPQELKALVERACNRHTHQPYSKLPRLLNASRVPSLLRPFARFYLRWKDDREQNALLEGVFCSELIVLVYKELGVELAPGAATPDRVSPNVLANSEVLCPVLLTCTLSEKEARRKDAAIDFDELQKKYETDRKEWVTPSVTIKEKLAEIDKFLEEAKADMEARSQSMEADRRKRADEFRFRVSKWRQALLGELYAAARLQDNDWYHEVLQFYSDETTLQLALHYLDQPYAEAVEPNEIKAYVAMNGQMIEFQVSRMHRRKSILEELETNSSHWLGYFQRRRYRRLRREAERLHQKAQETLTRLPEHEMKLLEVNAQKMLRHSAKSDESDERGSAEITPAINGACDS